MDFILLTQDVIDVFNNTQKVWNDSARFDKYHILKDTMNQSRCDGVQEYHVNILKFKNKNDDNPEVLEWKITFEEIKKD